MYIEGMWIRVPILRRSNNSTVVSEEPIINNHSLWGFKATQLT